VIADDVRAQTAVRDKAKRLVDRDHRRCYDAQQRWAQLASQAPPEYGCAALWRIVFGDSSGASLARPDVAMKAYDALLLLLESIDGDMLRVPYMTRCLTQVRSHSSSVLAWRLLQRLLNSFPRPKVHKPLPVITGAVALAGADIGDTEMETLGRSVQQYPPQSNDNGGVPYYTADQEQVQVQEQPAAQQQQQQQVTVDDAASMPWTTPSLIMSYANEHQLMTLFLEDLFDYKRRAAAARAAGDPQWALAVRGCGSLAHVDQVSMRLDFLDFVLANSPIVLTREHLDALWQSLIVEALNDVESELAYQWLRNTLSPKHYVVFADASLPAYLLSARIATSDPAAVTPEAFSFFAAFFRYVNQQAGHAMIVHSTTSSQIDIIVSNYDELVGVDFLWRVALDAQLDSVAMTAAQLLCALQRNVALALLPSLPSLRAQYVERCTSDLRRSAAAADVGGAVGEGTRQRLLRGLALLSRFVREFECERRTTTADGSALARIGAASESGAAARGQTFPIVIKTVGNEQQFNLEVYSAMTIGELREQVAAKWSKSAALVRIIWAGKELKDDRATVSDVRITQNCVVHLTLRVGDSGNAAAAAAAASPLHTEAARAARLRVNQPSTILSQPEHFGVIFSLLELGDRLEDVGNAAWALLAELPINDDILRRLRSVELDDEQLAASGLVRPAWSALLDLRSPLALLYALQLVHGLLLGTPALRVEGGADDLAAGTDAATMAQRNAAAARRFEERFIATGGLRYVLSGLLSCSVDGMSVKRRESLSLLLLIINLCLLVPSVPEPATATAAAAASATTATAADVDDDEPAALAPLDRLRGPLQEFGADPAALVLKLMQIALAAAQQPPVGGAATTAAAVVDATGDSDTGGDAAIDVDEPSSAIGPQLPDAVGPVAPTQAPPPTPPPPPPPTTSSTAAKAAGGSESHVLLHLSMSLLAAVVGSAPAIGLQVVQSSDFQPWLEATLLRATDTLVRERAAAGVHSLCRHARAASSEAPFAVYNAVLAAALDLLTRLPVDSRACGQFFALIDVLLRDGAQVGAEFGGADGLLGSVAARVRAHPVVERSDNVRVDRVLVGLLQLADRLLAVASPSVAASAASDAPNSLLNELFHRCLFDIATPEQHGPDAPPKCKRGETRRAAFGLLRRLAGTSDEALKLVLELLAPLHAVRDRNTWAYLPSGMEKAASGYVGLKNLGCTCYQNSLIQQLFMIRPFRLAILSADLDSPGANGADAPEPEADILRQLQRLFAHLQESERRYAETRAFCESYKDIDGSPVNPNVQMDVDEFCRLLFDRLESRLKQASVVQARVIDDLFALVQLHQVISRECPHVSEGAEQDYALSLEVRNRRSVQESLELFVEGDRLEGDNKYQCEGCHNAKVDALKRTCLKRLPRQLLVHAKRFEFDLDYMKRVKLNDRFEFPRRLDLAPFTAEGIARREAQARHAADPSVPVPDMPHPPAFYEFELRGVLVHTGNADSGHYYSYIREHVGAGAAPDAARWFEFNDTLVSPFDVSELPAQAFGGSDGSARSARINNAYMLFYDRVSPPTLAERIAEEEAVLRAKVSDPVALEESLRLRREQLARVDELVRSSAGDAATLASFVPRAIFADVWRDNREFLVDKHIFADEYFDFLWQLAQLPSITTSPDALVTAPPSAFAPVRSLVKLSTRFLFETLLFAKHKNSMQQWTEHLAILYARDAVSADWFIQMLAGVDCDAPESESVIDTRWLERSMLRCVVAKARTLIGQLATRVARVVTLVDGKVLMRDAMVIRRAVQDLQAAQLSAEASRADTDSGAASSSHEVAAAGSGGGGGADDDDDDDEDDSNNEAQRYRALVRKAEGVVDIGSSLSTMMENMVQVITDDIRPQWRTFEQFFELLCDVARLGVPHRATLVARGAVPILVDFYLGAESPFADPTEVGPDGKPRKYSKMGDKTTMPVLSPMAELLMILCCSAAPLVERPSPYAYPMPLPAAARSPVQAQLIGAELGEPLALADIDLRALRCLKLHMDLLTNKVHVDATVTTLCHLAWCDAEFSRELVAELASRINSLDANMFGPMWTTVHALAAIDDEFGAMRRDQLTTRLVVVLVDNTKYKNATMRSLDELRTMATAHDDVRRMLLTKLLPHLEALLIKCKYERVRAMVLELLQAIVPTLPASNATLPSLYAKLVERPGTNNDSCRLTAETCPRALDAARLSDGDRDAAAQLWTALLALMPATRAYTRGEQQSPETGNWQLASYFRTLRWLLHAPAQQEVFCARFTEWYDLFVAIDKHELIHDCNKSELLLLILKFVTGNEQALARFAETPDTVERLMNCFPEDSHQILTNRGFLFLDDVEALVARNAAGDVVDWRGLEVASYDPARQCLVYVQPRRLVINQPTDEKLVEITDANEAARWETGEFGPHGTRVSIICTKNHRLYVRPGAVNAFGKPIKGPFRSSFKSPVDPTAFIKMTANDVLRQKVDYDGRELDMTAVRFLAAAHNGVGLSSPDALAAPLVPAVVDDIRMHPILGNVVRTLELPYAGDVPPALAPLELTAVQVRPFLALLGFWLADGSMTGPQGRMSCIAFGQVKEHDIDFLQWAVAKCGLGVGDYSQNNAIPFLIKKPSWLKWFLDEYGIKYEKTSADGDALDDCESAKWLPGWTFALPADLCRAIICGVHLADGSSAKKTLEETATQTLFVHKVINTSSVRFRDELLRLMLHAGYTATFSIDYKAGANRGSSKIYTNAKGEQKGGRAYTATQDAWRLHYVDGESTEPLIRFVAATKPQVHGGRPLSADVVREVDYAGRTWCFDLNDGFVVVRRAKRESSNLYWSRVAAASGRAPKKARCAWVVTEASRPLILGQCFIKIAPNDALRRYNNETMPAFYMLIDQLCGFRPVALKVVLNHRNLKWALQYLFLENPEYAPIAEQLWHIFRRACEAARAGASSRDIRELMSSGHGDGVHGMLMRDYVEAQRRFASPVHEGKLAPRADENDQTIYDMWRRDTIAFMVSLDKMQRNPRNYFRLLEWALIAEQDRVMFVEKGGLKQLGQFLCALVEPNGALVTARDRHVHLTRGLIVLNDLLQHLGFWVARNAAHRAQFESKWRGVSSLARALHGIVSAPYAYAPLHVDQAHLALQRSLAFDTPAMLRSQRALPTSPLSLPDDSLQCQPIILHQLLAELGDGLVGASAFEVSRATALADALARDSAAIAAAATSAGAHGDGDDARSSSDSSYDLAVLDGPPMVGPSAPPPPPPPPGADDAGAEDDADETRPEDNKRRRVEPSVRHSTAAQPLDQAERDTLAQDLVALARDDSTEGKRRVVERYLRFALDVCQRAIDHVDVESETAVAVTTTNGTPMPLDECEAAFDVRPVVPVVLRLLHETASLGDALHEAVAQQALRLWDVCEDPGVQGRIVSDQLLHSYLSLLLTDMPELLANATVRQLVDTLFREARSLIDASLKFDIIERVSDVVGLALGMAQSVGDGLGDAEHAEIAHASVSQLILALRALCVVTQDREVRRHVRDNCGHTVDKLLSLLAAHRDALREEQGVLEELAELATLYRERSLASDANDSGDERARRWQTAAENDDDDAALVLESLGPQHAHHAALEDSLRMAEQFEDDGYGEEVLPNRRLQ
jgi:ubiquitin C-terminal hydrolase